MMRFLRDVRLMPVVLLATGSLFALKVSGLVLDGGYTLAERMDHNKNDLKIVAADDAPDFPVVAAADGLVKPDAPAPKQAWAKEMFNFGGNAGDVTGSVGEGEKEKKAETEKPAEPNLPTTTKAPGPPKVEVGNLSTTIEQGHIVSPGERAVLERLADRSQELDARNRQLDMRENLIKAAEKRLEAKVTELKDTEARIDTATGNRDKAGAARFKSIVAMYENMKPKDAARIFDRLDQEILVDVTTQINPRKMSDILAQMSPDAAERLTVQLAARASGPQSQHGAGQLPKIEGKPSGS